MGAPEIIGGKYQIARRLGVGGMGSVYEARHLGTGRRVAVKVIQDDAMRSSAAAVARFEREARAAGSIESQHIAQVLDTGVDTQTGHPYLVIEFLSGEDLHATLRRLGPLPPDLALRVVAQACVGLDKAHQAGVVHRDIKPANLFVARRDAGECVVKLLDFGIAKMQIERITSIDNAALTQTGSLVGSPLYMSPEQTMGAKDVDHRTDIWSLGVVLYEALAGRTPFSDCETLGALMTRICSGNVPSIRDRAPWVASKVAVVVERALSPDVRSRFESAAQMLDALRALLPGGYAIQESMLVSSSMEPVPNLPAAVDRGPTQTALVGVAGSAKPLGISSITNLAMSRFPSRRLRTALPITLGALVLAAAATLATLGVMRGSGAAPSVTAMPAAPPAAREAPVVPVALPTSEPALRHAFVSVAPASATVEVDSVPVVSSEGKVQLVGLLGSVHRLRVVMGKVERSEEVVIAETGAVPSSVELQTASPTTPLRASPNKSPRSPTRTPGPAGSLTPERAPPSPGTSVSPSPIDREFR